MTQRKELRLALVCYGGVSLAVYMHGITKELWKLLKASEGRQAATPTVGDSEVVWRELLDTIAPQVDITVICDVLSGASAGGINAILLGRAIAQGLDMEPLRAMWLENADVDHMLDPDARPGQRLQRMARFYKEPVAWAASRVSDNIASVDDPEVRAEIAVKLSGFVRSRWFQPPFSGPGLTAMLDDALLAMEGENAIKGPPLLPPGLTLDLAVTATDFRGSTTELRIHSPPSVKEKEHRRIFNFASTDTAPAGCRINDRLGLLFAARATASFPGAFPPAELGEVDARLAARGEKWPQRQAFIDAQLGGDEKPEDIHLIDGSILNNAPFRPALKAIRLRAAHHEVDRRFVYIDPKPGVPGPTDVLDNRPPGFFVTIMRALADIPREQPIRDSLEAIGAISARVRRLGAVIEGMTPAVDAAIQRAVGARFFLLAPNHARLARARSHIQSVAAREAGFTFAAYAQLKLRIVLDETADILLRLGGAPAEEMTRIVGLLVQVAQERGAFDHDAATEADPENSPYVELLRGLDIGFRVRRLRFSIRWLTSFMASDLSPVARGHAENVKEALHASVSPFIEARALTGLADSDTLVAAARALVHEADPALQRRRAADAMDALVATLDLSGFDRLADAIFVSAVTDTLLDRPLRQGLIRSWLGFPFYDIALLPLMQEDSYDSFDELKVDRISPDDAEMLRAGGTRACLKGWQLNAFAAFFSRSYRENDYLWGRLHAAERLVDILMSSARASGARDLDEHAWKARICAAILQAEREHLTRVTPLIDELEAVLDGSSR